MDCIESSISVLPSFLNVSFPSFSSGQAVSRIVNEVCPKHPHQVNDFIDLSKDTQEHRICSECIQEKGMNLEQVLSIRKLMVSTPQSLLKTFPDELQFLSNIESIVGAVDKISNKIDEYFRNLKLGLEEAIEAAKKNAKVDLETLSSSYKQCFDYFYAFQGIEKLQKIVHSQSQKNINNEIHNFIKDHYDNSENLINSIKVSMLLFEEKRAQFSIQLPSQLAKSLNDSISSIRLFQNQEIPFQHNIVNPDIPPQHPQPPFPTIQSTNSQLNAFFTPETFSHHSTIQGTNNQISANSSQLILSTSHLQTVETDTITYADGKKYQGQVKNGKAHGFGKMLWTNGGRYEGDFYKDLRHGEGTHYYPIEDGKVYSGQFKKGWYHGQGKMIWKDGKRYEGEFYHDKFNGFGIFYDKNGKIVKEGRWKNNEFEENA